MNFGLGGIFLIWLHILLPMFWPILVAWLGTLFYRRKINNRGKFFFVSCIIGYGVKGLVSVPWALIWLMFFDDKPAAIFYTYILSAVSVLITLLIIRIIATKYWCRLYP